jgi:hypothetical protein
MGPFEEMHRYSLVLARITDHVARPTSRDESHATKGKGVLVVFVATRHESKSSIVASLAREYPVACPINQTNSMGSDQRDFLYNNHTGEMEKDFLAIILEGTTITFIYATNADTWILKLGRSRPTLTITKAHLNEDLKINI